LERGTVLQTRRFRRMYVLQKMSRYIRDKKQIGDYHFITVIHNACQ
jgi:hypothetical protein